MLPDLRTQITIAAGRNLGKRFGHHARSWAVLVPPMVAVVTFFIADFIVCILYLVLHVGKDWLFVTTADGTSR